MKVAHISTVHPTFDGRIFHKECVSLANAGFDTHLIIGHTKNECVNGVQIHSLPTFKNRLDRIFRGNKIAFKKALEIDAEVYHLHDPELLPLGLKLKKKGYKVIFDMHELVGLMIKGKKWIPFILRWLMEKVYTFYESKAFRQFEKIIVVTEKMVSEYTNIAYPKFKNKVEIIRNYSLVKTIADTKPVAIDKKGNLALIYVGGLTNARGIKTIISAVQNIDNVDLWLLGPWESDAFHQECGALDVKNKMQYFGYQPMSVVYQYIQAADIGLTILHPTVNHLASLPVKAFEYMAASKPQIMSNFPFWKSSFDGCAFFVDPTNAKEIEVTINQLVSKKEQRNLIGNISYECVKSKFSWESQSKELISLYEQL